MLARMPGSPGLKSAQCGRRAHVRAAFTQVSPAPGFTCPGAPTVNQVLTRLAREVSHDWTLVTVPIGIRRVLGGIGGSRYQGTVL